MTEPTRPRRTTLVFPALKPFYELIRPNAYALMRFATGLALVPHGLAGLAAGRSAAADVVAILEIVAGLLVAMGLFTRVGALLIALHMAVATVGRARYGYAWTSGGYEYPLLLCILNVAIFFRGGGQLSCDKAIGREL